ncbi:MULTISPECIES: type 2 periplasmic-binding domain-containing protein [Acetobacter]|uniref:Uncharacterized protein n=1 Tax=Acetobacter lovaniensis TaxID=104100 RepID=A0A841QGT3_9PROT|nr:hypothetical protein [Acetobacter lovaniensis]MBB6457730.1 hypothetical protein [Acetobacter lovaniensis]MCI1698623.1 hypothetical protein [Acetobacter lovaniensis]MCI1796440.1 hypothetical protein [Acetobacter lovaniensis]MCP1239929.1 hypothetical protein [Acetobacter lovaniensis]NHN82029.1 hypothetical protein [Acetobacter lovaniensis]
MDTMEYQGDIHPRLAASSACLDRHGASIKPAALAYHVCLRPRDPTTGELEAWPMP